MMLTSKIVTLLGVLTLLLPTYSQLDPGTKGQDSSAVTEETTNIDQEPFVPRLPEFYGQGYNIFTGNPFDRQVDKGFTAKQVFEMTYAKDKVTQDGMYFHPKEVSVTHLVDCDYYSSSLALAGLHAYHQALQTSVSVSGGYDAFLESFSFTGSVEYSQAQDELSIQEEIAILSEVKCILYEAALKLPLVLSQDFKESVAYANTTNNWKDFLASWGTHYGFDITLGAAGMQRTLFAKEDYQILTAYGINVAATVNADYQFTNFDVGTQANLSESQQEVWHKTKSTKIANFIGQTPPLHSDISSWISDIHDVFPAPLQSTLKYIGDLFDKEFFGDLYTDEQLKALKNSFDTAFNDTALTYPPAPGSDAKIYKPKILESRTMAVGGSGGAIFEDPPVTYPLIKAVEVEYRSAQVVDNINLVLSSNENTPAHGSDGGSPGSFSLSSTNNISLVKVWFDKSFDYPVVSGIKFHYQDDGDSPLIGTTSGTLYEFPMYGSLVGLYGRSAQYVDAIGFISNVLSFDPDNPLTVPYYTLFYGGNGGEPFDTIQDKEFSANWTVTSITIQSGGWVDAIQIDTISNVNNWTSPTFGNVKGLSPVTIDVRNLLYIEVWHHPDYYVNGFNFVTKETNYLFGSQRDNHERIDVPEHSKLAGIYGRSANYLDRIGFIFARTG